MSQHRREKMLKVIDGKPELPPYMFYVNHLARCDDALDWLIRNNLTGQRFLDWMKNVHAGSIVNVMSHVLSRLERDKGEKRPVIFGKDYF